ncbi:homoserine dehydrogenase [Tuwongella immobilis]|uniref:Homoserine dehydrogenase n=1 Tax=Tuwongella immobilis TaxID=692036 RepID=A0A6C2YIQ2_9BACT|nr:homoserine dehydrogenase [Tuwongella immobilis]VIP00862.1 homoserine dehydrogenase : Homoserine dehydrogenase OS=Pirellula staleyi (strain ATCC 27377 / DSM 6068 / ICPB 4128) GN=Psta_4305 PE=3 SV=1: NAD_binding_3: Homoserine_dh: ACT [Tuwongella immobilis]VTR97142.1 homoserine dehydrogenase : Homoserine dehydrogenase OS=Pirellula staleyi (strain ATCC 27377 / DSM 6068 / ICPB 4128) GN=Psta_4305 PE=3 SV=1: NAD_binding_3: Homoserine_dh: ACT [Tuwongella immobilis]
MDALGIALIGCGTVGTGVAKILLERGERMLSRAGRPLELRRIVVRDPVRPRDPAIPTTLITTDFSTVLSDPNVHVVVELVGGTQKARQFVLESLHAGKHVVTANKALLAEHGTEVFEAARQNERTVAFEASVAGGVPIIAAIGQSLAANQVTSIQGILNGTSNFILTAMADKGQSYADALAEAQRLGYAEADPTLDVDGSDAAHKLGVLARLGFGIDVPMASIERIGIDRIDATDLKFAQELGYVIKLLAEAWLNQGQVAMHVAPVLLRRNSMLAQVRGAYNAIQVMGDVVGETLYMGPGAGMMPTASSVVADLIDLAVGRAQRTFQQLRLWEASAQGFSLRSNDTVTSRFYLRLQVDDRPGMLAEVARVLASHQISIASVIQHEPRDTTGAQSVPLVIMTHAAPTGGFRRALDTINQLPGVHAPCVWYSVAD